jgi:hypothetical protein
MAKDCCWNCGYFIPSPRNNINEFISFKIPVCIRNRKKDITPEIEGPSEGDESVEADHRCEEYKEKEYHRETSRRVTEAVFKSCEESGSITEVGPEYYEDFIDAPDEFMVMLVCRILANTADQFNRLLKTEWISDEEMYEFVKKYLRLVAQGVVGFSEENGKMLLFKPVGPLPSGDILKKIEEKICNSDRIIDKAILACLPKDTSGDEES